VEAINEMSLIRQALDRLASKANRDA
jgi:hypothetical protein